MEDDFGHLNHNAKAQPAHSIKRGEPGSKAVLRSLLRSLQYDLLLSIK